MPAPMHSVTSASDLVGALQFVERGAENHRAGRAERMAHRDGAAVEVDLVRVEVEGLQIAQHDGGEGLVDLDEVDVLERQAGAGEQLLASRRPGRSASSRAPSRYWRRPGFFRAACGQVFRRLRALPISTAAAPSTMPEELPA